MKVTYCDICGQPIKGDFYSLTIIKKSDLINFGYKMEGIFLGTPDSIKMKTQEVCESCFAMLEIIFSLKKKGVKRVLSELEEIYNLTNGKKGQ